MKEGMKENNARWIASEYMGGWSKTQSKRCLKLAKKAEDCRKEVVE